MMNIDFSQLIIHETIVLVPAVLVIGALLKRTPSIPDWLIPWILLVAAILASIGILGFNVQAVVQGILVTGSAVLGHQLVKQTKEGISQK